MRFFLPILITSGCSFTEADFERSYPEVACARFARCPSWHVMSDAECFDARAADFGTLFHDDVPLDMARARECLGDLAHEECDAGVLPEQFESCREVAPAPPERVPTPIGEDTGFCCIG